MVALGFGSGIIRGNFEGERVGTPFLLLKSCQNACERRFYC